jgi:dCTP deaminase
MAFWSSQTLKRRLSELVNKPTEVVIDCNAIELKVGSEIYITPNLDEVHTQTKQLLSEKQPFQIPPGQFAFLLTEETVYVPPTTMAFISMKATFKMKGLVNVSGFHVDPGWKGPLIFAVFNAGPAPIHLQRGLPLFLVWYADLDEESEERKTKEGQTTIPPAIINNLTGASDSLYALDKRLKDEIERLEHADEKLSDRIHALKSVQTGMIVTFSVLSTILVGLIATPFRTEILSWIKQISQ